MVFLSERRKGLIPADPPSAVTGGPAGGATGAIRMAGGTAPDFRLSKSRAGIKFPQIKGLDEKARLEVRQNV
jgi:hypothetical protein